MVFSSLQFIAVFLPVTLATYFLLGHLQYRKAALFSLIIASLYFYFRNAQDLVLAIGISALGTFAIALVLRKIDGVGRRRFLLWLGLAMIIGVLGYFKYTDFLIENLNSIADTGFDSLDILLPLGISFIAFQQIMYLVDSYEGLVKETNFLDYIAYLVFFPKLLSGPITPYGQLTSQWHDPAVYRFNYANLAAGALLFLIGLLKKVVLADNLGVWVDAAFATPELLTFTEAWFIAVTFTLQVYFDFSGYTDMAVGVALMFNIGLPMNFNSPLKATSIIDFWQRWHMTLTRFLTTYVFTATLRLRRSMSLVWVSAVTMLTMLISGIWHGATWVFVLFGVSHGVALVVNRVWRTYRLPMPSVLGWVITFLFVVVVNVLFRAESLDKAREIYASLLAMSCWVDSGDCFFAVDSSLSISKTIAPWPSAPLLVGLLLLVCIKARNSMELMSILQWPVYLRVSVFVLAAYVLLLFGQWDNQAYVYFMF